MLYKFEPDFNASPSNDTYLAFMALASSSKNLANAAGSTANSPSTSITAGFKAFQAMRCDSGAWEAKLRRETSLVLRYDSLLAGPDGGALGEECGCAFGFVVGRAGLAEVAGFVG